MFLIQNTYADEERGVVGVTTEGIVLGHHIL